MSAAEFAALASGGRVRIAEIVTADPPSPTAAGHAHTIAVKVKGVNAMQHIGVFPSRTAAVAWLDQHMPLGGAS